MSLLRPSASLAAAGTVVLWASAFPAISVAVPQLGPVGLAVARLVVASAALAVAAPFLGVRRPRSRDLPLIAGCGLAGMTGYQLLLNTGERVVPAGTASLLVATAPVYASLLAAGFLGERLGRRWWAGSGVALAGTAIIAASHGLGFGVAALVVLAAAVAQGIFHTAQKPLLARYTGFEVTVYAMWAGTLFIAARGRVVAAGPAARRCTRAGLGRLPRRGALGGRIRAVGLRAVPDGRRPGHAQPLPGTGGGHRHLPGLAGPDPRPGRTGWRGGGSVWCHPGHQRPRPASPWRMADVAGWGDTSGWATDQGLAGIRTPG